QIPSGPEERETSSSINRPDICVQSTPACLLQPLAIGRSPYMIWLHTYGQRLVPKGKKIGTVPQGKARCIEAVPGTKENYPDSFSYDEITKTLQVGEGKFQPVSSEVWEFSVSGLEVVKSWLSYRMLSGAGRKSSPLDDIRPDRWTSQLTEKLLELLWVLESTVATYPKLKESLEAILASELFSAKDFPFPSSEERKPPHIATSQLTLET
ncbi:MAG: type ISP restriction/modification enzyme, partial [Thermoleophilia bacterium]